MNVEMARHNMIEQQIRTWEVLDQRILDLIASTPREAFVPQDYRQLAFADISIPLAEGQVMMPPKLEARMIQALEPSAQEAALEIGTGSAYVTALLGRCCRQVLSLDCFPVFIEQGRTRLKEHGVNNVELLNQDLFAWETEQLFDVIAVTGSLPLAYPRLREMLRVGGRLFVIVGHSPVMEARLITRRADEEWSQEDLFETDIPALVGAPEESHFSF